MRPGPGVNWALVWLDSAFRGSRCGLSGWDFCLIAWWRWMDGRMGLRPHSDFALRIVCLCFFLFYGALVDSHWAGLAWSSHDTATPFSAGRSPWASIFLLVVLIMMDALPYTRPYQRTVAFYSFSLPYKAIFCPVLDFKYPKVQIGHPPSPGYTPHREREPVPWFGLAISES
jgi:hypothetical protein